MAVHLSYVNIMHKFGAVFRRGLLHRRGYKVIKIFSYILLHLDKSEFCGSVYHVVGQRPGCRVEKNIGMK